MAVFHVTESISITTIWQFIANSYIIAIYYIGYMPSNPGQNLIFCHSPDVNFLVSKQVITHYVETDLVKVLFNIDKFSIIDEEPVLCWTALKHKALIRDYQLIKVRFGRKSRGLCIIRG